MLLEILAGLGCLVAAFLQFAVYRSPDCVDTRLTRIARRIIMVALFVAALAVITGVFFDHRSLPAVVNLILILISLSQTIFALSDLLPHLEKEHQKCTSRLTSSR